MLGEDQTYRIDKVRINAGLIPKVFDKTILDMARVGTITLKEGTSTGLSAAEIGNMVRKGETIFMYFSFQAAGGREPVEAEMKAPETVPQGGPVEGVGMRRKIVRWLDREFVTVSCEGRSAGNATDEMEGIFSRVTAELKEEGLSLEHTIRTRLWAVDRRSRDLGSDVRAKYNAGQARAATSSYILPGHFASEARVGLDLIALRPSAPGIKKIIVESDPPRKPVNYLVFDGLLVLAGKTVVLPTLEDQLDEILPRISGILTEAGSCWKEVVNVSCYLDRSQDVAALKRGFSKWVETPPTRMVIAKVEGYSAEGKLIEIEVTAEMNRPK